MNDVKVLECVQRSATNLLNVLEGMSCEEQLRTSDLSGLEKSKLRGDVEEEVEREVVIPSPWDPVTGCVGTVESCIRRGSD